MLNVSLPTPSNQAPDAARADAAAAAAAADDDLL